MTTSVDVLIIGADASGAAPCPGALMTVARDELLETEPERVTRQFEAGGSLGLSPAEKVERLSQLRRAKVYMSFTASRRKPPRSPVSHNLLKPCPSLARWSGSKRRRRKDELLRPDLGLRTRIHHASTSQLAAALPHTLSDLPTPNYTTAGVRKGPGGTIQWKRSGWRHSPTG